MFFNQFFFITQSEKRGTIVLLFLIGVLLAARVVMAQYATTPTPDELPQSFPLQAPADTAKRESKLAKKAHFTERKSPSFERQSKPLVVELNTADTTALKQLKGIGSTFANRIVQYRNRLGGFYHPEQLLEVYHFPLETYQKIATQVKVDSTQIQKMPINQLDIKALKRHPYIGYFQAKSLYENRLKRPNQRYEKLQDLVEDRDVTQEFIQRIAPYLSFR
jgi:DNA uptake protein ComE-like DNA-binding protein